MIDNQQDKDLQYAAETVFAMIAATDGETVVSAVPDGYDEVQQGSETMDDTTLQGVLKAAIEASYSWNDIDYRSQQRIDADKYYRGDPTGDEKDGRSKVVSRDVAEAVDSLMPSLMRVFAGGDKMVKFTPNGPGDEEAAEQATDYINHIFMEENDGFMVLYEWFKDALLKKNGIVKTWFEEKTKKTKEVYQGLPIEELEALQSNPDIEIVEITEYTETQQVVEVPTIDQATGVHAVDVPLYDCVAHVVGVEKKICIENVPPDEFILERRAVSLKKCSFCAQRSLRTVSDLIESGFPPDLVESIPAADSEVVIGNTERDVRFNDDTDATLDASVSPDKSMKKVWVVEAYIKVDYDNDGVAEWRKVTLGGNSDAIGSVIIGNEEVDDHPFSGLTPVPMPHKFFGMSVFDQTKDIQDIKTALVRGMLDNMYLVNSPRTGVVDGQVNLDDLLDYRINGVVRMKRTDSLVPITTPFVAPETMTLVNYFDKVRQERTGTNPHGGAINPDALHKTTIVNDLVSQAGMAREELIARIFAETGVKDMFRRIFKLTCMYEDKEKVVRLRNSWVQIDPRSWKDKLDVTAVAGIGMGDKRQQAASAVKVLEIQQAIMDKQGGTDGPLCGKKNVHATLGKLIEAIGWYDIDPYFTDPGTFQPPPPPPPTPTEQMEFEKVRIIQEYEKLQLKEKEIESVDKARKAEHEERMRNIDYMIKKLELAVQGIKLEQTNE